MTALDHLRAVLAVTNDKAYRTAGEQNVIEQAKRFVEDPTAFTNALEAALCRFAHGEEIESDYLCRHEEMLLDLSNQIWDLRHGESWGKTLGHNIRQAAWLIASGPACGEYLGLWYGDCCG